MRNPRRCFAAGLSLALILNAAPPARAAEAPLASFEWSRPQDWKVVGPAAETTRIKRSEQKKDDQYTLQVDYKFKPDANDYVFIEAPRPVAAAPKRVRMNIFGDGAGASLRVNFVDKSDEFFQAYIAKVDWKDWKEVDVPLEFPSKWGGDGNGQMDAPLRFHSLVVNSEPDMTQRAGQLVLGKFEVYGDGGASRASGPASAPEASEGRGDSAPRQVDALLLDDFERPNPGNIYQTWRGDQSSVNILSSSEFKQTGSFSMQVTYVLSTTRSDPSWVSVSYAPDRPFNWTGGTKLALWVKGDGTRNHFRIQFIDGQDRVWAYQDDNVMKNVGWTLLEADFSDFEPMPSKRNVTPDLGKVRKIEYVVLGEEPAKASGKIWIDGFSLIGKGIDAEMASPGETAPPSAALPGPAGDATKLQFGDLLHTEFRNTPEFNREMLFYNAFYVRGSAKNLTLAVDLVSQEGEAGKSIPFTKSQDLDRVPAIEPEERRPAIELAYYNATLQNLHPNLASLSVGNLYVDYGRDVFSPLFGFKGVQAEGKVDRVDYNTFILKHVYDAFTWGSRVQTRVNDFLLRGMMVIHEDTARSLAEVQQQNGQLTVVENQDVTTSPVARDQVYFVDADRLFWKEKLNIYGVYAIDFYHEDAKKDVTNIVDPTIDNTVPQAAVSQRGQMAEVKVRLKDLIPQDSILLSYRRVDVNYKPRFRADPIVYDTDIADVRGASVEWTHIIKRFKVNLLYDDVHRGPRHAGYFRRIFRQTYGLYNMNRWDVVFSINERREFYALAENNRSEFIIDPANPKNEDARFFELFLGHWFTPDFFVWTKWITENTKLMSTGRDLRKDIFVLQSEYAVLKNAKLTTSITQTRFDDRAFEPFSTTSGQITTGSRTRLRNIEDNQVRVFLDVNF